MKHMGNDERIRIEFMRRILRKGVSFNPLTQDHVNLIMSHLNSYPHPSLGGRTLDPSRRKLLRKALKPTAT